MSPERQWKTDGEIRSIVHEEMRDALNRQNALLDKIADGAQAQMFSAAILHGNPAAGIEGFVPNVTRRLAELEAGQNADRVQNQANHTENSGRLEKLESGQHRLRRMITSAWGWLLTKGEDGGIDFKRLTAVIAGAATVLHYVLNRLPSWDAVKRFLVAVLHAMGKMA